MNIRKREKTKRVNFSLIELLIVIAVVAILCALLLPALAKVREKAQSISCINNLKTLHYAVNEYLGNNNSWYYKFEGWRSAYSTYLQKNKWLSYSAIRNIPKVYICPTGRSRITTDWNSSAGKLNNINYQQGLVNGGIANWPLYYTPLKAVYSPSAAFQHYCVWINHWNETGTGAVTPSSHDSGRPLLYVDGHVSRLNIKVSTSTIRYNGWKTNMGVKP